MIESTGQKAVIQILDSDEYIKEIKKKAFEELDEFMNAKNNEESLEKLADVLEILYGLPIIMGHLSKHLMKLEKKRPLKEEPLKNEYF